MDNHKALEILSRLADGIDPHTGEVFPAESPYQHSETVRALYRAINEMTVAVKREDRQKRLPGRAGESWTQSESDEMVARFEEGLGIAEIAKEHQRTRTAIESQLIKCGKIPIGDHRFHLHRRQ